MNACFEKECPKGFAHIGGFQYDTACRIIQVGCLKVSD